MRIFIDSEFLEDGHTIMPISLALVTEDGRELYIEFAFDEQRVLVCPDQWVAQNVLPRLTWPKEARLDFQQARHQIELFIADGKPAMALPRRTAELPEFWAYFASYDWVLLCRLWGRMVDLPRWMPHLCMDAQQWYVQLGRPEGVKPEKPAQEHNALADARWVRQFWQNLRAYEHEHPPRPHEEHMGR